MIALDSSTVWLFAFGSGFFAVVLYWARVAVEQGTNVENFLNPLRSVPSFTAVVTIAASGFVPFLAMGFADGVARNGFGFAAIALGCLLIPLVGIFLFKRVWALAVHLGTASQASFFDEVFGNKPLAVLSALIAALFAVAFGGRVMTAFALLYHGLTGGAFDPVYSLFLIAAVIAALAVIGGIRGVMFTGAIHGAMGLLALIGLVGFTLYLVSGFDALAGKVVQLQEKGSETAPLFSVSGIVQFTLGSGHEAPAGSPWTATMVLSTALAFLGLHASPVLYLFAVSSKSNRIFGPGLTWVAGGAFGAAIMGFALIVGGFGLVTAAPDALWRVMSDLSAMSPWFAALLYFGLFSLVFALVAGSYLAASQLYVVDVYRRYFHPDLSDALGVASIRVLIVVLVVVSVLMSITTPVATAELASLCLPLSAQLLPAMIAACYRIGISRASVAVGAFIGVFCVFVTEAFGIRALAFVGLDLPWGQWPWTIHSAGWGLFFNVGAVLVISIITRFRDQGARWNELTRFLEETFPVVPFSRPVISTAWSVGLAWFFLAIGPGLAIGNSLFVRAVGREQVNMLGLPSIVVWVMIAWASGVAMNWFFADRMQLATLSASEVREIGRAGAAQDGMRADRMATTVWIVLAIAGGIATLAWIFG